MTTPTPDAAAVSNSISSARRHRSVKIAVTNGWIAPLAEPRSRKTSEIARRATPAEIWTGNAG
jgi:hypothetical protein